MTNKEIFEGYKETYAIKLAVQEVDIKRILRENVEDCDAEYVVIAIENGFSIFFRKSLANKIEKYNLFEVHEIMPEENYMMIDTMTGKMSETLLGKNIRSTGFTSLTLGEITSLQEVIEKIKHIKVLQKQEDELRQERQLVKIISG